MTTPEQARQQADKAEDADWFVSQKMLRDLAMQLEELQAELAVCEDMLLEAREFGDRS